MKKNCLDYYNTTLSSLEAKLARPVVGLLQMLDFVDPEAPDPDFFRHRTIFVINTLKDPPFVLDPTFCCNLWGEKMDL